MRRAVRASAEGEMYPKIEAKPYILTGAERERLTAARLAYDARAFGFTAKQTARLRFIQWLVQTQRVSR
jgi:hypothetical protein